MTAQLAASVTAAAASLLVAGNPPVAWAAGAVTGTVFHDANANGTQEGTEAGVPGITITAWQSGTLPISTTTTTDASGLYTLTLAGADARVEFTGLPFGFESSPVGTNTNTSVRFVTTPASSVNFGIFQPNAYCQNNPQLITACFTAGDNIAGVDSGKTNVFSFPYSASGNSPDLQTSLAIASQVGSVFGVAYQRHTRSAFVSAYTKRLASYGPGTGTSTSDGTGTIYRILNDGSNTVVPFVDLDDLFGAGATGANPHTGFVPVAGDFDGGAFGAVGKTSLGDVDMGEDDSTLWTVNLADRTLYGLPLGTGPAPVAPTAAQVISTVIPSLACTNGTGRPFAVKPFNGLVYVGGVCTAEDGGTSADLQAYVYAYNPATAAWAGPVLQFPLNYPRTCVDIFTNYSTLCKGATHGSLAGWRPWSDTLDTTFPAGYAEGYVANPQPILSGIEFVPNGIGIDGVDMVVAFRDRWGDQIGSVDNGPQNNPPGGILLNAVPAGDILRAGLNAGAPAVGAWTIESNSQSNPAGTFGPTSGANSAQGPGGGEFYLGDALAARHDEIVYGGIAHVPGLSTTVATAMDPIIAETSGVIFLNNTTGLQSYSYQVRAPVPYGQISNLDFRKANGMGDIEVMCDSAPIEIGNRVWLDADHNGVQDPGESPIANVAVSLTTSSGTVVTATTNADGEYRFSSAVGTSTASAVYNLYTGTVVLAPFSVYTLTVDTLQPAVAAYSLTVPTADPSASGTARDSNGVLVGSVAVASVTTTGAGANNHTYDFGFYQVPPPIVLNLGNRVWYDTNNNGSIDATEVGVDGVALDLYRDVNGDGVFTPGADGPVLGTQTTSSGGYYTFTDLAEGGYLVVITTTQFAPGTPLYGYCNSTASDSGNTDVDNRNHGNVFGPVPTATSPGLCLSTANANIVASTVVTLTPNSEPPPDGDSDGTNGNLTIDFGFYRMVLGNLVWNDLNHNGSWEPNEPGMPGVTVRLLTPSASVVQTTTTDVSGIYTFTGLISGTYCGEMVLPPGYTNTITVPTSLDPNNDVDHDNNGVIVIGGNVVRVGSNCLTMIPGAEPLITNTTGTSANPTLDFGIWQPTDNIRLTKNSVPPPSTDNQPSQVGVGTRITYTLSVRNGGISTALNVVLSDVVPADTVFVVGSANPSATPVNNVISWTIPQLNVGQTAEVSFAVDVVSRNGVAIENTAYALSSRTLLTISNRVVHVFTPTAISLVNFDATGTASSVLVQWGTGLELDTFGFLLYRSATGSREDRELVTAQLIPAQGGNGSYRFEDKNVTAGTRYTYWLVEVEQSGGNDPKLIEQGSTSVVFGVAAAPSLNVNAPVAASAAGIGGGMMVQAGAAANDDARAFSQMAAPVTVQEVPQMQSVTKIELAPIAVQPAAAPAQVNEPNRSSNAPVEVPVQVVPSSQALNAVAASDAAIRVQPAAEVAAVTNVDAAPVNASIAAAKPAQSVQTNVQNVAPVNAPAEPAVVQEPARSSNGLWLTVLAGLMLAAVAGAGLAVGVVRQARRRG